MKLSGISCFITAGSPGKVVVSTGKLFVSRFKCKDEVLCAVGSCDRICWLCAG